MKPPVFLAVELLPTVVGIFLPRAELKDVLEDTDFWRGQEVSEGPGPGKPGMRTSPPK